MKPGVDGSGHSIDQLARGYLAWILAGDLTLWRVCMIEFISDNHAQLQVIGGDGKAAPETDLLLLSASATAYRRCQLCAFHGNTMLVKFVRVDTRSGACFKPNGIAKGQAQTALLAQAPAAWPA